MFYRLLPEPPVYHSHQLLLSGANCDPYANPTSTNCHKHTSAISVTYTNSDSAGRLQLRLLQRFQL